jgi:hypothetical protein
MGWEGREVRRVMEEEGKLCPSDPYRTSVPREATSCRERWMATKERKNGRTEAGTGERGPTSS